MKKSSIFIMILMMAIQSVMAQQGENLVQNGTFEQGNVGFKSDFRFFSDEAFIGNLIVNGGYYIVNSFSDQKNRFYNHIRLSSYDSLSNSIIRLTGYEKSIVVYDGIGSYDSLGSSDSTGSISITQGNPEGPYTGSFLAVHVTASGKQRLWYDSITIKPNTAYSFSCIVSNVYYGPSWQAWIQRYNPFIKQYIPGIIGLCVNEKKVSEVLRIPLLSNKWRTLSGKFTSGPDQTRIEISIQDWQWRNSVAVDNIVFKEMQAGEIVKKEERFPKLHNKSSVVASKKEPVIEIPPVKEEEPIAVITPAVKKEEAVIETPPIKEPVVEIPPAKEEEPIVEILPKPKSSEVVLTKSKATVIVPPKPKLTIVVPPKPKPPVVIQPKAKPSVLVPPKAVKKDTTTQSADFKKDISIDEINPGQKLQLSHIYFERAKSNLLSTSLPELNDLVTFMKRYPTVRIRLEGHTDIQGNPELNLELSENRAKEIKKYLVDQGIEENRIEWIGYGGQRPIHSNANAEESLRQKNRRVEILIISK